MTDIQERLFSLQDLKYRDFIGKLTPNIKKETIIGVRAPQIKAMAKDILKNGEATEFLEQLPHKYYEENMLHSAILTNIKDFDFCLNSIEKFLPYVDNWAVCDTIGPKVLLKNKDVFIKNAIKWTKSKKAYTCRFGIEMLMNYFLNDDFKKEYLEYPASVISEEYYVNMMIAWFFATALAKQWDETIVFLTENRLPMWVHNKTIQKARESFRITPEQKEYLNSLKRKS